MFSWAGVLDVLHVYRSLSIRVSWVYFIVSISGIWYLLWNSGIRYFFCGSIFWVFCIFFWISICMYKNIPNIKIVLVLRVGEFYSALCAFSTIPLVPYLLLSYGELFGHVLALMLRSFPGIWLVLLSFHNGWELFRFSVSAGLIFYS